ncbi:MAG: redox-regulated ATPase YchF [Candidatus Woesearchaeota archaeon]
MLVGIVGKPSCGKSTFFKAATLAEADIANYPFTTIKPNHGVGYVKVECADKDFGKQCNPRFGYCIDSLRFVPVDLLDVAGLVPGAHEGQGRGNEFLDDLNQADVLIHVIDVSGSVNEKGEPVQPLSYNPAEDIKFLELELDMWYFRNVSKGWEKFARQIQQENQEIKQALAKQLSFLRVTEEIIEDVIKEIGLNKERPSEWTQDNLKQMASALRKITKPMIIAANKVDVPGAAENFAKLQNEFPDYMMIACSAESELALKEAAKHDLIKYIPGDKDFEVINETGLSDKQKQALEFVKINILDKLGSTGVQQVLDDAVFKLLKYITIFPGGVNKLEDKDGNVLPDCFLLPQGSTALDFAYSLHTDLGDGFIRAIDVRTKMVIGKEHVLKNRDVVEIISSK